MSTNSLPNHHSLQASDPDSYLQHDRWTRQQLEDYQAHALQACREYAYTHSPFYQRFHRGITDRPLQELPVLTKAILMEHFDELVTDRTIRLEDVRQYLADPDRQERFLNRYRVMATSGSTGQPGVFLASQVERSNLTVGFSRFPAWAGVPPATKFVLVASTASGHMTSQIPAMVNGQLLPRLQLSASDPVEKLVWQLNEWQPALVAGYPSILDVLAKEQQQERLQITPRFICSGSEILTDGTRQRIEHAWHTQLFNIYAATESGVLASECAYHRGMHLYEDLLIVEVVDERNRPVPPGVYGDKVLLTVLFSRTQPLIRYEVSDRVSRSRIEQCHCRRPFALLEGIEGRAPEVLHFPARAGGEVAVVPHVFHRIMDMAPAGGWQVVQEQDSLQVLSSGATDSLNEATLLDTMQHTLAAQGVVVPPIRIQRVASIPKSANGKAPLIVSNVTWHSRLKME
jgi:putative adenylate-forming enzyme